MFSAHHQVEPVVLARQQILPVVDAVAELFPEGGLRRGSSVSVSAGSTGVAGVSALGMLLAAAATRSGSWAVFVGVPNVGLAALDEAGVVLERVAFVARPDPSAWASVVGALVGAVDLIYVAPGHRVRPGDVRRLASRSRERGSVMVHVGGQWPDRHDLELRVIDTTWSGLGSGYGCIRKRRVTIEATGRREASRPRRIALTLDSHGWEVVESPPTVLTSREPRDIARERAAFERAG